MILSLELKEYVEKTGEIIENYFSDRKQRVKTGGSILTGKQSQDELLKDPSYDHCYLTFSQATSFTLLNSANCSATPTIPTFFTHTMTTLKLRMRSTQTSFFGFETNTHWASGKKVLEKRDFEVKSKWKYIKDSIYRNYMYFKEIKNKH